MAKELKFFMVPVALFSISFLLLFDNITKAIALGFLVPTFIILAVRSIMLWIANGSPDEWLPEIVVTMAVLVLTIVLFLA